MGRIKQLLYIAGGVFALLLALGVFVSLNDQFSLVKMVFLIAALCIMVLGTVIAVSDIRKKSKETTTIKSNMVLESLHSVLKVVTAEGQFTEIIDFSHTSQKLSILSSTKKALIIAKATVAMGYDFSKMEWDINEKDGSIKLINLPDPHIISVTPDINYYNIENGLFNRFNNEDLNKIQEQCMTQVKEIAMQSNLPNLAAAQIRVLLSEFAKMNHLKLEGTDLLESKKSLALAND